MIDQAVTADSRTSSRAYLNFAVWVHYAAMICMAIGVNFIPVFIT
jgi:hypothetical protein